MSDDLKLLNNPWKSSEEKLAKIKKEMAFRNRFKLKSKGGEYKR